MESYESVYQAFIKYAASRDDSDWFDLWIVCNRRMEALVKTKAKRLKVPLPEGDIDDIIIDSAARVMVRLKTLPDVTADIISKTFWYENLSTFRDYNRDKTPDAILRKALAISNRFLENKSDCP